jgi:hypothetical protein
MMDATIAALKGWMTSKIDVNFTEKQSELSAVLESREFLRSPALARLLKYLCDKTFQGKIHEIKEFSIATEVFGKDLHFGERRDSLVRVEVSRLRRRLQRYYETEGADHDLRIVIKAGAYRPEFERVSDRMEPDTPAGSRVVAPAPDLVDRADKASPDRNFRRPAVYFAAIAALILVGFLAARLKVAEPRETSGTPAFAKTPAAAIPLAAPRSAEPPQAIRILAGSLIERSVDRFGVEWLSDRYFIGGEQNKLRFGSQERSAPNSIIRWAPDQTPFRSFRFGSFSYRIPLPQGKYELRLYFSEVVFRSTDSGDGVENQRVFDVSMNGGPLLSFFDIAADAGGVNTADIRVFENVSPAADGFLTLEFRPIREAAWLNAIELIPNNTGRAIPIHIAARNATYTDHKGQLWGIDRYYLGGRQGFDGVAVNSTDDPELFLSQRYGNFAYRFPVPAGKYKLRLLFAETFFGPHNRGKGGIGSRIFNVYCSGVEILRDFDIFKEAGENRAIEKVFHGVTPDPQGRVELRFAPVVQYALVQGIELTAE